MEKGEGERLHDQRRKRFWTILGWLMAIGFVAGLISGYVMAHQEAGRTDLPSWGPAAAMVGVVLAALAVAYGSWRFFVSVDEVEIADNLWGSLIGFYTYAILFPAWWAIGWLGGAPEPDQWAIFVISMVSAVSVYFYRKWRYS